MAFPTIPLPSTDSISASALALLRQHGMERALPVRLLDLCGATGIRTVVQAHWNDPEAIGILDNTHRGTILYVADHLRPTQQRFAIAHLLAHFLFPLPPDLEGPTQIDRTEIFALYRHPDRGDFHERAANQFAAALLMPTPVLQAWPSYRSREYLAECLAVSFEMLTLRFATLDRASPGR